MKKHLRCFSPPYFLGGIFLSKRIIISSIVVVLVSAGLFMLISVKERAVQPNVTQNVKVQTIENSANASNRIYSGVVKPRFESQLSFQIGGKILERLVDRGEAVKKGQLLMKLDPKDVNLSLQEAQADLDKATSERALAHTNLVRYKNLYEQNAVSKSQLEDIQNQFNVAESGLRQASANLDEMKRHLGFTELLADHDGVIVEKKAEAEQVVQPGEVVLIIQQGNDFDIEINVPEQRVGDFRDSRNIAASAVIPAVSENKFQVRIRDVSPQADNATRSYGVKLAFTEEPAGLSSGMTAIVEVVRRGASAPIMVPISALYKTIGQPDSVWVLSGDRVFKRTVELGEFGNDNVQIKSGLSIGDQIIIAGVQKIEEGQKVKIWTGMNE